MPTKNEILLQLHSLQHTGFADKMKAIAATHGFPATYFFAIASRETNCLNILGDFQGGQFHGVGIVQIDIQHKIAKDARDSGTWKTNPDPLLAFGADILKSNIHAVAVAFPAFSARQQMKVAASGYNCGVGSAIDGAKHGDSDMHTTGKDYGRDVMLRMDLFDELIAEGN